MTIMHRVDHLLIKFEWVEAILSGQVQFELATSKVPYSKLRTPCTIPEQYIIMTLPSSSYIYIIRQQFQMSN